MNIKVARRVYSFGQKLNGDGQFCDHVEHKIPIQIYLEHHHKDIGFIENFSADYVQVNQTNCSRKQFTFVSRPGY